MTSIVSVSRDNKTGVCELILDVHRDDSLSSNVQLFHYSKAKRVKALRDLAIQAGINAHTAENKPLVEQRVDALRNRQEWHNKKTATAKKLKKKGLTAKEIEAHPDIVAIGDKASYIETNSIACEFLFDNVTIDVFIGNTVNRDFDPPNLWPTVKAITDGLTDCAWWEDDNFSIVKSISFNVGEKSPEKQHYRFKFVMTPVSQPAS